MRFLMFLPLNQSVKHLLTDKIYLKHTLIYTCIIHKPTIKIKFLLYRYSHYFLLKFDM